MKSLDATSTKFDTLDALRFFAFFRVFILHIPNFFNSAIFEKIKNGGGIGVDFFFVLSGFLITYLLAKEKSIRGQVDAKKFIVRRILRIWPLYYLGVLLSYANVLISQYYGYGSNNGYMPDILYSATFTENIKMLIEDNFPNGAPLRVFWSLCVEEQFYILWVIIFKFFNLKNISKLFFSLIGLAWFYRISVPHFLHNKNFNDIDLISNLDYFCVGGLLALSIVLYPENIKKIGALFLPGLRLFIMIVCFSFFLFHQFLHVIFINNPIYSPTIVAIIFTILIACFIIPGGKYHISNNSLIARWGNISYGLYVYHTPVILVLLLVFKMLNWQASWFQLIFFILLSFFATLIISILSYKYIEQPFLKLRSKYFSK